MNNNHHPEFVQSLEKGLAVIKAFSREKPALTLSEVAKATNLTRAAARRFLITLEELGYVACHGREFSLRPTVLSLGYAYLSSISLPEIAQPHMEALVEQVRESCSAAVLDGTEIVYIARVPTKRIMTISLALGSRLPAYCTSMGRILLAGLTPEALEQYLQQAELKPLTKRTITHPQLLKASLDEVRAQGWSMVDQELEEGLRSISAPITDRRGAVVAAINLSTQANRVTLDQLHEDFVPRLLDCSQKISTEFSLRV